MVASTTVMCQAVGDGDEKIVAQDLQAVLGAIYGKAVDASKTAYAGKGTADDASKVAYSAQGTLENYISPTVGKMDYEMDQVFEQLGLTRGPAVGS